MRNPVRIGRFLRIVSALLLVVPAALFGSAALAQTGSVKVEWLGWSAYRFTSPTGKVILTHPFYTGNPEALGIRIPITNPAPRQVFEFTK